jgi:NAD(P)H-nitrite reductase large subunit
MLAREQYFWDNILPKEEARMISRHILAHGIDLRLSTNLREILPDAHQRVRAVVTEFGEEINCQFVALTPGVSPNTDAVRDSKIAVNRGVLVNDYLETNIKDVFSAGDCAEIVAEEGSRNRIEQLWYTGRMQGIALAKTICDEHTRYERGIWYNSAKFMDIEYQTYGFVSNVPRPGEDSFYWEHSDQQHCVRLVYRIGSEELIGCNFFGIRQRQETWQRWIADARDVDHVVANLRQANFDPEFFRQYEDDIIAAYNQQRGKKIVAGRKHSVWHRMLT